MKTQALTGHILSFATIIVWGTTFICTKLLLESFTPVEIMFYRIAIGFGALLIINPRIMKAAGQKLELMMAAAGLCGVTLYFIFENFALTYSTASNVGILVSTAPLFTSILAAWLLKEEKLAPRFFVGFIIAIAGISLILLNGRLVLHINPLGDMLALAAAAIWGVYSILIKKLNAYGLNIVQLTRRVFLYGLIWMVPAMFFNFSLDVRRFTPENLFNILFLGVGASALCFVAWNYAIKVLGAVKTSAYIYLIPVVTVITSIIVLKEQITFASGLGIIITLVGLFISEGEKT